MGYDRQKVIDIALAEVGYLEKASNADLDDKTANTGKKNFTKYARDLDAMKFYNGRKQGVAWCDVFVNWDFVQAYGKDAALAITFQPTKASANCGAGCKYSRQYYQKKGRLFDTPEPGDQVFFYSSDKSKIQHTGLVYKVDDTYVYTVEGNTSGASGVIANGGGVCKKKYKLTYSRLAGFGRPDYGEAPAEPSKPAEEQTPTTGETLGSRTLSKGMKGADVKELQQKLLALGYSLPRYGADGSYGSETMSAVMDFQKDVGLKEDGKYTADTHKALLAATQAATNKPSGTPSVSHKKAVVAVSKNGRVNVRVGNGTGYRRVTSVNDSASYEWIATAGNGWHAILVGKQVCWISGEFSKVI